MSQPSYQPFGQPPTPPKKQNIWPIVIGVGVAGMLLVFGVCGVGTYVFVKSAQNMAPKRDPRSNNLVDYYEYKVGAQAHRYDPKDIVHFRYPDPKDPYTAGLSPLRACWEQASLSSEYLAFKKSTWEN